MKTFVDEICKLTLLSAFSCFTEISSDSVANVPLRNDHSLLIEDIRLQGFLPALKPKNLNIPFEPQTAQETRYSELSATWGIEIPPAVLNFMKPIDDDGDVPVGIPWADLDDYSSDEYLHKEYENTEKCKFCAILGVPYEVRSPVRLEDHMKMK